MGEAKAKCYHTGGGAARAEVRLSEMHLESSVPAVLLGATGQFMVLQVFIILIIIIIIMH